MIIAAKGAAASNPEKLPYQWIAYGNNGELSTSTSTTASSWTVRTSSFGTTLIRGARANGSNMYVAVGSAGKLATSPDGITWTQRTSSFSTSDIYNVAFGNGVWVAVGDGGKLATATDPTGTWTQRTSGSTVFIPGIQFNGTTWCYLNGSGQIYTATDPTGTWTNRTVPISVVALDTHDLLRWCPDQGLFVAGSTSAGATNQIMTSPDGITWTARSLPNTTQTITAYTSFTSNSSVIAAMYTKSGGANDIATSPTGATWTDRTPAGTGGAQTSGAVDDAGLLAFSYSSFIQTSSDGTTWTSRTAPSISNMRLAHSSGG